MPVTIELDQPAPDTSQLVGQVLAAAGDEHEPEPPEGPMEFLVPIVLFLAIALTYCAKYYFAHRTRQEVQGTVRIALERGQPLTPEILDRLGQPGRPRGADLRRGIIAVMLGLGLGAFGLVIGEPAAVRPMLAVGLVPLLLGLAYLALWRIGGRES